MIKDRSIVAIIPVRGGSKGVPGKNLRHFKGRSLLALTIETALSSSYIDKVIVTTEDAELIAEAKRAGADVPFVRPQELAADDTPGIDPILHAIGLLTYYDYTVVLQVTSPLRSTEDINSCIEECYHADAPACVSVVEADNHPHWMFSLNATQQLTPLVCGNITSRRQDLPKVYALNGAIYIAKTSWLKQTKSFVTEESIAFVMPQERSLDIDSELDFLVLEAYSKRALVGSKS